MDKIPRKRVNRYLHYEEYVVDLDFSDYSEDEVIEIKAVHDSLNSAIPNLLKSGLLKEICTFLQLVANNCFPLDNISFLLFLDVVNFYSKENVCAMRYRQDTYLFWIYGYLLLKGRFLRLMGGTKFRGNIIENSSSRGSFCPKDSKINFIVPSEPSLKAQTEFLDTKPHRTRNHSIYARIF